MTATPAVEPIPPRKKLSKKQRIQVFDQCGGICWICELPIDGTKEAWEAEHPHARGRGGSDDIKELKPAHVDCHKPKTAEDKRVMAETVRIRAKHLGVDKAIAPDRPMQGKPLPTTRKAAARAARGHKPSSPPRALYRDVEPATAREGRG